MNALKLETQQKILQAAREVFIEKGLQGARMQEIADRAGINKALLHYYYRSKDQLFESIFEDAIGRIIPQFASIFSSGKPLKELMFVFFNFYNDFFRENPYMPQFFFHEIWQNPENLETAIKSQDFKPEMLLATLREKLPSLYDSEFLSQHMISNVMGMCLFPHIARPLFQRMFFNNDDQLYNRFLSERTDMLMTLFGELADTADGVIGENPDDDF